MKKKCNTLLWLLPTGCTHEVQGVDASYRRLVKVQLAKELNTWVLNGDKLELWESNKPTASDRRILITQWTGRPVEKIDSDIKYRRCLFE